MRYLRSSGTVYRAKRELHHIVQYGLRSRSIRIYSRKLYVCRLLQIES